ncbi:MAG: cytidylate kinase-like family protein [Planctomycetota bacterium]|jgi:cytidylate kinase|nr:cytidylate kinase-like family protein [Planctomycetota bacterium]
MAKFVVTISREYGSGGHLIGSELATDLGVECYDRNLVELAAQESGFSTEMVDEMAKRPTDSFLYSPYIIPGALPLADQVFLAQSRVIQDLVREKSCVIIGRCANYVLREDPQCLNVFIHAPLESRVRTVREVYAEKQLDLASFITKKDKERAAYYNFFTPGEWGDRRNYHLSLDSSIGFTRTARVLKKYLEEFLGEKPQ